MYPKIPKILIKEIEESEDYLGDAFNHIAMTTSTCERPSKHDDYEVLNNENSQGYLTEEEEKDDRFRSTHEFYSIVGNSLARADSAQQTEQAIGPESDEKFTSTKADGIFAGENSVQTQSISNANVSTDVNNLVEKFDQEMATDSFANEVVDRMVGSEEKGLEDKDNQTEVSRKESALDPIIIDVNDQSINTIEVDPIEQKHQAVGENHEPAQEDDIDSKLSDIVKRHMQEMTPMLLEECQKYIKAQLSDNHQKPDKNQPSHEVK